MLEVGTGFHPEMTARENIFMNGSIMGMTRHEITSKLDEIVEFAEAHHVKIVPELEIPGHSRAALAAYPEFACVPENLAKRSPRLIWGIEKDVLCIGNDRMFEIVYDILDKVCEIAGKTYNADKDDDISIRVCTDHIKSAMFMIADGVIPSNEGRGYVLRRIIRRACRHGKLLGIDRPFLVELCEVAMAQNDKAYPELAEKHDYVLKVLSLEERKFDATIDAGLSILNDMADKAVQRFHSTTADAARCALEAGAGRLIVGHYSSRIVDFDAYLKECTDIFPATTAARDGDSFNI